MKKKFDSIYQFKITLKESKPPIWRQIQVPETYTFWDLHVAIQDAFGWEDYHLHEFEIQQLTSKEKIIIGIPNEDFGQEILPDWKQKISDYFTLKNNSADYIYDFGDDWLHSIILEKILPSEKKINYPRCINGKRACPPEDCGGIWGYEEFLEAIKDPKHEQHKEMKEWIGGDFDPEYFNPSEIVFDNPKNRLKTSGISTNINNKDFNKLPGLDNFITNILTNQFEDTKSEKVKKIEKEYKKYRKIGMNLIHKIIDKCLDRITLKKSAKLLGISKGDEFFFDSEDETSVLMDFALNDYRYVNENIIEKYQEKFGGTNQIEKNILNALTNSYTSLFKIVSIKPYEITLELKDLLNDKEDNIILTDIAFSSTLPNNNFLLFTRIISFKNFNMTGGVSFIFPADKTNSLIEQYNKKNSSNKSGNEAVKRFIIFYELNKKYGIDVSYI